MTETTTTKVTPIDQDLAIHCGLVRSLHSGIQGTVIQLKLRMYFIGLEMTALKSAFEEKYGETRGGGKASEDAPLFEDWIEERLGLTRSTAYRYRKFFSRLAEHEAHAETVKRLNEWWLSRRGALAASAKEEDASAEPKKLKPTKGKGTTQSAALVIAAKAELQDWNNLLATDLQALLDADDDWGLHDLFAKPIKETLTPEPEAEWEPPSDKARLIAFWHDQLGRKLSSNEFLKLPKAQREALATWLEEAAEKIKATLKPAKKLAKAKEVEV